ncbi:MAG: orotate phosphoribosyltransferase [Bacteroidia bacterium]|nr:orotate phosphoribosyltransferase [Bacteroidia bacterium]
MLYDDEIASKVAAYLLEINAVKLSARKPFTWVSGMRSPIYCDNRLTLSYPHVREFIKQSFSKVILNRFRNVDIIVGVATAGIPHGALVAEKLKLPFAYVRANAKAHGLQNLVEGKVEEGQRAVLIEDLISTGGSSIAAVKALRERYVDVLGLCAIFTYGFAKAEDTFSENKCDYYTLSDYPSLINYASANFLVELEEEEMLLDWYKNPANW